MPDEESHIKAPLPDKTGGVRLDPPVDDASRSKDRVDADDAMSGRVDTKFFERADVLEKRGWTYADGRQLADHLWRGMSHPVTGAFTYVPDAEKQQAAIDVAVETRVRDMDYEDRIAEHVRLRATMETIYGILSHIFGATGPDDGVVSEVWVIRKMVEAALTFGGAPLPEVPPREKPHTVDTGAVLDEFMAKDGKRRCFRPPVDRPV